MTAAEQAVDRLLQELDGCLPFGARAAWAAADGSPYASGPQPAAPVAELLPGLAELLRRRGGLFGDGSGRVLFESSDRSLMVYALGQHGMVTIDAGPGLNLALVRRAVAPLLAEFVAAREAADEAARPSEIPGETVEEVEAARDGSPRPLPVRRRPSPSDASTLAAEFEEYGKHDGGGWDPAPQSRLPEHEATLASVFAALLEHS